MTIIRRFHGGVHPAGHKEDTAAEKIRRLLPDRTLTYPLSQHIGAGARVCVTVGERVRRGQMLAEAQGNVSAPIHCAVSGTVKAIGPVMTARGEKAESITVENDEVYDTVPGYGEERDVSSLTPEEIIAGIRDAGIVGLGGAGFPMHVKLAVREPEKIRTLIVNGAECEPYLTCDYRLMLERGEALCRGLLLLLRLYPNAEAVIALEDNKRDAAAHLRDVVACEKRIRVALLPTRYPQGGEHMLIYALTGERIRTGQLPADVGCVVVNVASVIAADDALERSMPLTERVMTVCGDAVAEPGNFLVSIGDSFRHVLHAAGGLRVTPENLIAGGPMMGSALFSVDVPVTKTASGLLAFAHDPRAKYHQTACIRCGACVRVCPEGLVPQMLAQSADREQIDRFVQSSGLSCIECGCCAYACPAKLPLVQSIRYGKRAARQKLSQKKEEKK